MTEIKKLPAEKQKELLNVIETNGEKYNIYPLSAEQMQMWFLYMFAPDVSCYNCLMVMKLKREVSDEALREAIGKVIRRNDILHTVYLSLQGKVFQSILNESEYDIPYETLETDDGYAEKLIHNKLSRPFKLSSEIPVRVLRHKDRLFIVKHHIANDGWSDGIFVHDLKEALYGRDADKKEYQYIDYCRWQEKYMESSEYNKQLAFWKDYLKDNSGYLELPLDRPRGKIQEHSGAAKRLVVSDELYRKLDTVKKAHHTSMYNLTLAAWFITLYYFTGQPRINIGTPVLNRLKPEFQNISGCFIHTAAVSCIVDESETIGDLIDRVRKNIDDVLSAQSVPIDQVINELDIERSLSFSPLYQVFFSFQSKTLICRDENDYNDESNEFFEIEPVGMQKAVIVQNDIDIVGIETGGAMTIDAAYNTAIFNEETISFLLDKYCLVLEKIAEDSGLSVSSAGFEMHRNTPAESEDITPADACGSGDEIAASVREIWEQVLDSRSFTNDQNFFDVGGNSMNCLELMERINSEFGCELSIADLFVYNTVSQTSEYIMSLISVNQNDSQAVGGMMF